MDAASSKVYKSMGFTHTVPILSVDRSQPDGYKAVKATDDPKIFTDENGQQYTQRQVDDKDQIIPLP